MRKAQKIIYESEAFNHVYITDHAHKRWKQRVGKLDKTGISKYIRTCARRNKIEHYWDKFYIIDDDIVIRAEASHAADGHIKSIRLITTFGRISDNPALNNIEMVVKERNKYGKMIRRREEYND